MKNLKITFAIIVFSLVSNTIVAQEQKLEKEDRKIEMAKQFKIAKEKLALTPDQEIKFKEISLKFGDKIKEIRNSDEDKKTKFKQLKEIKSQKDAEMKAFLSESQFKTYLELLEERHDRMKDKKRNRKEE
jgi:hypothetical protein